MIKEKISDNIYEIYVEKYPDNVELDIYRGDYFSFTIIGFNYDDTPFDFFTYDSFKAQLRIGDPRNSNIEFEFSEEDFLLGQTDEQSNLFNELHLTSEEATDFSQPFTRVWLDIQGILNGEKKTLMKILLNVESDVTR